MPQERPRFRIVSGPAIRLLLAILSICTSHAYEVWYGLPYMEKGAGDERRSEWPITASSIRGLNLNNTDRQRPDNEQNAQADWRAIVASMPLGKNNGIIAFQRTSFDYGDGKRDTSLREAAERKFQAESNLRASVRWVMPFGNQPGEDRDAPVYNWSDSELQELRDWLDSTGRSDVRMMANIRNFGAPQQSLAKKSLMRGISIEAKASVWFENGGRRQDFLHWALQQPETRNEQFVFQMPFKTYGSRNEYQSMRSFVRWLSTTAMLGSTDFVRRDDVAFLVITYEGQADHLPEMSANGQRYLNTLTSTALSLIEQKDLFEGRGGLISVSQADSDLRTTSPVDPTDPDDSDGDGKADTDEASSHRNPADAGDLAFEFNSDGDREGWGEVNISNLLVAGRTIGGLTTNSDPQLQRSGFSFDANSVPSLVVRLRAGSNANFQFFWGHSDADFFTADRRLDIPYDGSGAWRYIQIPVSTSTKAAEWNNRTITRMRLDPIGASASTWEIDWIRGTNGDHDGDGLTDATEGFPGRDSDGDGIEDWADPDSDNDGAPDFAEAAAGRDPYSSVESDVNADGDAYSDLFEIVAGTDPDDRDDDLDMSFSVASGPDESLVTVTLNGKAGRSYRLKRSSNLQADSWELADIESSTADGEVILSDSLPDETGFYRVEVVWDY